MYVYVVCWAAPNLKSVPFLSVQSGGRQSHGGSHGKRASEANTMARGISDQVACPQVEGVARPQRVQEGEG